MGAAPWLEVEITGYSFPSPASLSSLSLSRALCASPSSSINTRRSGTIWVGSREDCREASSSLRLRRRLFHKFHKASLLAFSRSCILAFLGARFCLHSVSFHFISFPFVSFHYDLFKIISSHFTHYTAPHSAAQRSTSTEQRSIAQHITAAQQAQPDAEVPDEK